jgi:hypothetical protein
MTKKNTHGGAGRGQGRKPLPDKKKKVTISIQISVDAKESISKHIEKPSAYFAPIIENQLKKDGYL